MRAAWAILGAVGGSVGLIGLAHAPFARPLLRLASGHCPAGFDQAAPPEVLDAARARALPSVRGDASAPARPAMGFALDQTTTADLKTWGASHAVPCQERGVALICGPVPAGALEGQPDWTSVSFQSDGRGTLISISANLDDTPPDQAVALVNAMTETLGASLGPPAMARGNADPAWLGERALAQYASEFRFQDYRATISATNVGQGRVAVRAVYQSLVTPTAASPG